MVGPSYRQTIFCQSFSPPPRLGLVTAGSTIVADHLLKPGAPRFLWYVYSQPRFSLELLSVQLSGQLPAEDELAHFDKSGTSVNVVSCLLEFATERIFGKASRDLSLASVAPSRGSLKGPLRAS